MGITKYEDIPYCDFETVNGEIDLYEATRYTKSKYFKMYSTSVRLPEGKDNIVYLLSSSIEGSVNMLSENGLNKYNFIVPNNYRYFFTPWVSNGRFFDRMYKLNIMNRRMDLKPLVEEGTGLRLITNRKVNVGDANLFFDTSGLFSIVEPNIKRLPPKKIAARFYKDFVKMIFKMSRRKSKYDPKRPESSNRILIIDVKAFRFDFSASVAENKTNPMYILYLMLIKSSNVDLSEINIDILLAYNNIFIKLNPSAMAETDWQQFKSTLFRMMKGSLEDYTDTLPADQKKDVTYNPSDKLSDKVIDKALTPVTMNTSGSVKEVLRSKVSDIVDRNPLINDNKKAFDDSNSAAVGISADELTNGPIDSSVDNETDSEQNIFKSVLSKVVNKQPVTPQPEIEVPKEVKAKQAAKQSVEDTVADEVNDALSKDEEVKAEVLDEIQKRNVPLKNVKTSPLNSVRDQKMRERQKLVTVQNSTIEEILALDSSSVKIQTSDKSKQLKTTNTNMHNITFANFDKTYIEELMTKDIVSCFDMLKDKNTPFYVTGVEVKDTSTNMDYKDTWTVNISDETGKRSTIKVDMPKMYNNKFLLIGGTKYIMLKQNFYNPLVKDTPDTVIMTTNMNKVTITRKASKSIGSVERVFAIMRKMDDETFTPGSSKMTNLKYVSTLEYDELAAKLFKFETPTCTIIFSRDYLKEHYGTKMPPMKDDEFLAGFEGKEPIILNENTNVDRKGRTIIKIIEEHLPEKYKDAFNSVKVPKQPMYVEAKMAGQFLPVAVILIMWIGMKRTLEEMKINWEFLPEVSRVPKDNSGAYGYVRFADGVLKYEKQIFSELIMNGINKIAPERFAFEAMETEECYADYIYSVWGKYTGISEIKHFYEFMMDPITKQVCKDMMLPDTIEGLLIHGVKLLSDNAYVSKVNDGSYRVRSVEVLPAMLYSALAAQYKSHINSGRRIPMTLNQNVIVSKLMKENAVIDTYSTLNPTQEVGKFHSISPRGYKGSNSDHSYDEEKRSYDPTALGKLAMSTSADANVGIARELVIEPTISNARGYRKQVEDVSELQDINIFSPIEMLTPGTARNEDPIRTAIAGKQSQHLIPVANSEPTMVSNGFDEAIQHHLSNDFVINAEEDGEVVKVDEKTGFIIVKYKSGKCQAINTNPEMVNNSNGGFYLANQMVAIYTNVGDKFKQDEPLAYHSKYFKHTEMGGLRYCIGPLVKVAFMSTYNTYEDAGICTATMAQKMKSEIVFNEAIAFKRNANILSMVKIGDHVNIGDPLIKYDVSFQDDEIAKYLSKLNSDYSKDILTEETKNEIKAKHAGKVVEIKVFTLVGPEALSQSLGAIVQTYFDKGNAKKNLLAKYDDGKNGIVKAGYMLTDSTEPVVNKYNTIKGHKATDVLIEIYISHDNTMTVGDKIALYSANKQIVSEVIPEGLEPFSEFHKDEEISVLTSPGTIARRMTPAVITISAVGKALIELKHKINREIKYK